ncbi:MAG: hypothetical protein JXA10_19465 [Anaerolineae bacterium]|nr:hypothetical protein [Anaerolineae bacterium]
MSRFIRMALVLASLGGVFLGVAFYFQWSWVKDFWPWSGGYMGRGNLTDLSYYFVSSILIAIAMPNFWVGLTGEFAALVGGAMNLGISASGIGLYMLQSYQSTDNERLLTGGIICLVEVGLAIAIFLWARRIPFADQRSLPRPLRVIFGVFAVLLVLVGGALILKWPNVFPWPLRDEVSVVYGWIFLGAAFYFMYGILVPKWHNAAGQMMGFLAYDVVLILPFLDHFDSVRDEHRASLIVYTAVVILSGLLAAFYLFIYPPTRLWRSHRVAAIAAG